MVFFSRLKNSCLTFFFLNLTGKKKQPTQTTTQPPITADLDGNELVGIFDSLVGYRFRDPTWLVQALKHRSFLNVTSEQRYHSYERLEFLGDAVLNLIATEILFKRFPDQNEGEMTKKKAALVNQRVLAEKAKGMQLDRLILLSKNEEKIGGRQRASILADALESVLGAIYMDSGYDACHQIALRWVYPDIDAILQAHHSINYKGILLEYMQAQHIGMPYYHVIQENGPEHRKEFTVQVMLQNKPYGVGKGFCKKVAEQQAARQALLKLKLIT